MRAGPGGFHGFPIFEIKFDDGVPAWGIAFGIFEDVILFVVEKAGEGPRQRSVDLFEMVTELFSGSIGAAVEDDHELEHPHYPNGLPRSAARYVWAAGQPRAAVPHVYLRS